MKVKLVYETAGSKELIITMNSVPRVGERLITNGSELVEVVQVVHTPTSEHHDAIVHLRSVEDDGGESSSR